VTPHDSGDSRIDPARQNQRGRRVTRDTTTGHHDSARSPGDRADKPSPQANESSYAAAAPAGAQPGGAHPLRVKITFVVVHGTAAEELIKRQGAAVREALEWFASHPPEQTHG
jgi:hypothetical protein